MKVQTKDDGYGDTIHTITEVELELGNNYSYNHFATAVYRNKEVIDYLNDNMNIGDEVIIIFKGLYSHMVGLHKEHTCGSDLNDHFRSYPCEWEGVLESEDEDEDEDY